MICFLTSNPFLPGSPYLNPANGFLFRLKQALASPCDCLFVCSDPDRPDFTDTIAGAMRGALEAEGFSFSSFRVLDGRTRSRAAQWVLEAGLIVLAGGHVPTQNAFFQSIGLKEKLKAFHGVLLGISAGSMNCCDPVYAQPEEEGEAVSPSYRRFLPGLGAVSTMLLPHYQMVKNSRVDGLRLFADITLPDSMGRVFYAIPDGSYLLKMDKEETLFGEAWRIRNGAMEQISGENSAVSLTCPTR